MIQLVPQLRILLACQPVDFRCGIDGLAAICKREFAEDPFSGALFVFRNRRGTALKMLWKTAAISHQRDRRVAGRVVPLLFHPLWQRRDVTLLALGAA